MHKEMADVLEKSGVGLNVGTAKEGEYQVDVVDNGLVRMNALREQIPSYFLH